MNDKLSVLAMILFTAVSIAEAQQQAMILLRLGWLIAWHIPGGTSRGSPRFRRCWLANDWSYSRKPFLIFPALQCCGIHRIQLLRNNGKKVNCRHGKWAYNLIPWRSAASINSKVRSKEQ